MPVLSYHSNNDKYYMYLSVICTLNVFTRLNGEDVSITVHRYIPAYYTCDYKKKNPNQTVNCDLRIVNIL